jgi:LuxR family quorum sensing-dependent transcriptional regulator
MKNLPDLSLGTFDFIESVQRLTTPAEIAKAMRRILSGFGVEYLCFNFLPDGTQTFEDVLLANWLPPGWLELYIEQDFVHVDPAIRFSRHMRRPYRWFKDCPYNPEQEPWARELMQRTADFGLLDGIIIPLARPAEPVANVWAGGRAVELTGDTWPSVHLMALYAFDRVVRLRRPSSNEKPCLTSRERESLTLAAIGKPAWEIGDMLRISKRTANAHMASARGKLGAINRTQAVMIALREGIIQP